MVATHDAEKKYMEFYAKALLEALIPEIYSGIKLSEEPDLLVNDYHGIEVNWAMFDEQGRANGLLNCIKGKALSELDEGIRRNVRNSNIRFINDKDDKIVGYILGSNKNQVTTDEIHRAYLKKNMIRGRYQQITMDLFIFPPLAQIDD